MKKKRNSEHISDDSEKFSHAERLLGVSAFLFAGALRIYMLGNLRAYDLDEAHMILLAQGSWSSILEKLQIEAYPPLYFFLLNIWTMLWGVQNGATRSLSVVFAMVLLFCVFFLGRRIMPQRAAFYAFLLLCFSPLHVFFAREARMYSLLALCGFLVFYLARRAVEEGGVRRWIQLGGVLTVTAYVHSYGIFLYLACALCLLLPSARQRAKPMLMTLLASFALHIPWIPTLLKQSGTGGEAWMEGFFRDLPAWAAVLRSMEVLGSGGKYPVMNYALSVNSHLRWLAIGLYAGVFLAFLVSTKIEAGMRKLMLLLLLAPLAIPWLYSMLATPLYVVGRYDVMVQAIYCATLGLGLYTLAPFWRNVLLSSFICLSAYTLYPMYAMSPRLPTPDIATHIIGQAGPKDLVMTTGLLGEQIRLEFAKADAPLELTSFPNEINLHPGWVNYDGMDLAQVAKEAAELTSALEKQGRRIWLVPAANHPTTGMLLKALSERYVIDPSRSSSELSVFLFNPRRETGPI